LKKIISPFFLPVPACLLIALIGLFFLWFTRRQKTGKVLVTIATLVLAFFSYSGVSDILVRPLEQKYPPITDFQALKGVKWIVVLGGGSTVDHALPLSTYLSDASLARLSEAACIHNKLPQTRLIFSGRSGFEGFTPVAEVMGDMALELGIKPEDIIIEPEATDTKDHPIRVKEIIGSDKFILVTSASHMPRAMALFREHDMHPTPAPTDYLVMQEERFTTGMFFPDADSLVKSGRAIHEYLGIMWAKLRSQI
jgi:uncharacterized SAM-binding protein YcdF (DUF218 family)